MDDTDQGLMGALAELRHAPELFTVVDLTAVAGHLANQALTPVINRVPRALCHDESYLRHARDGSTRLVKDRMRTQALSTSITFENHRPSSDRQNGGNRSLVNLLRAFRCQEEQNFLEFLFGQEGLSGDPETAWQEAPTGDLLFGVRTLARALQVQNKRWPSTLLASPHLVRALTAQVLGGEWQTADGVRVSQLTLEEDDPNAALAVVPVPFLRNDRVVLFREQAQDGAPAWTVDVSMEYHAHRYIGVPYDEVRTNSAFRIPHPYLFGVLHVA